MNEKEKVVPVKVETKKEVKLNDNKFNTMFVIILLLCGLLLYNYYNPAINNPIIKENVTSKINFSNSDFLSEDLIKINSKEELVKVLTLKSLEDGNKENSNFRLYQSDKMVLGNAVEVKSMSNEVDGSFSESASVETNSASEYSETNVQVNGVDEPDIVKNDGKYIYSISGNKVIITKAYPVESLSILSTINFDDSASVRNIFLSEDKLVVFIEDYVDKIVVGDNFVPSKRKIRKTYAKIYDIKDRSKPILETDFSLDGDYYDARMIDGFIYFISKKRSYFGNNFRDIEIPRVYRDNLKLSQPEIYYFNSGFSNYFNFFTIASFNIVDFDKKLNVKSILSERADELYVSKNNIYLSYQKYFKLDKIDLFKEVIMPKLPSEIKNLVKDETDINNIYEILENYYNRVGYENSEDLFKDLDEPINEYMFKLESEARKTIIHKIAIDKGNIEYKTKGMVNGYLLNQFSLDEDTNENLRVATTTSFWSRKTGRESFNNVYILNSDLELTGKLENLAKGEKIYSTRFVADKLYMVTFKQIDPLFVIDISDVKAPKVLGKLKIPGYSTYLHPYDENLLIGLGYETKQTSPDNFVNAGIKLSLFDISDFNNPKEVDKYVVDGQFSDSIALYDHHAFLFSKEKNLLVIPIRKYDVDDYSYDYSYSRAVYVFNVNKTGFNLKGIVKHTSNETNKNNYYWRESPNSIKRSLFMDNVLYTISQKEILANSLDDLKNLGSLDLGYIESEKPYYPYYSN